MKCLLIGFLSLTMIAFCNPLSSFAQEKKQETKQEDAGKGARGERGRRRGRRGRRGGQRGREDNAPKTGDVAPLFTLKSLDGESETDISTFNGEKPVVLLFGSYT